MLEMFPGAYPTCTQSNDEEFKWNTDMDQFIDAEIDNLLNYSFSSFSPSNDDYDMVNARDVPYASYESLNFILSNQNHEKQDSPSSLIKNEENNTTPFIPFGALNCNTETHLITRELGSRNYNWKYNGGEFTDPLSVKQIDSARRDYNDTNTSNYLSTNDPVVQQGMMNNSNDKALFSSGQQAKADGISDVMVNTVARELLSNSQYDCEMMLHSLLFPLNNDASFLSSVPKSVDSLMQAGSTIGDRTQITPDSIEVSPEIWKSVKQDHFSSLDSSQGCENIELNKLGRFSVNPLMIPYLEISLEESAVQCLAVVINYHGYRGNITSTGQPDYSMLSNQACNSHDYQHLPVKPEQMIGHDDNGFSEISCVLQRIRYTRRIDDLINSVTCITYCESGIFGPKNAYEPQFYRFELTESGKRINGSKCGLCPYCEEVKFLPFKNSSYLSHLTLEHGIFSNNYLIPDCLYYGYYLTSKLTATSSVSDHQLNSSFLEKEELIDDSTHGRKNRHKVRRTKAIQCPACFKVIEVGCWSMKTNPLLSYFRHFKKVHSNLTVKSKGRGVFNTNKFVNITKRGRTLKTKQ